MFDLVTSRTTMESRIERSNFYKSPHHKTEESRKTEMQDAHVETTNTTAEQHLETRKVVRLEASNAREARTGGERGRRRTHTCGDTRRWWWRPGEACGRVGMSCTRPAAPVSPSPPGAARPPPPPPSLAPTTLSRPSRGHRAPHFHAWSPRRGPSSGTAPFGSSRRIDPRITRRRGKRPGSEHRAQPRLNFLRQQWPKQA
ncbi:hypothetical protein BHE74_00027675 [Ensete ventricosum]|uniref:Uncharacterized protein n=1 Tax=Ensete ventricosum TaxID=4639 RepID=A0A427A3K4_ENSVE|nr:hypothetical protein B296_00030405 [Ensete ventricosum]RWW34480.1 hypothetical protein GW17_00000758 [Ensete ventricosum]RWW65099.1 hypothetical protein BHE74_00027675 [Ensete ventricosum]RZR70585.1 hypothetical protein BHM03_00000582 [Ensete ventricosum]